MEEKKKVAILATIALILAATAITLNVMDSSEEMSTMKPSSPTPTGAVVGINIEEPQVEDKMTEEATQ